MKLDPSNPRHGVLFRLAGILAAGIIKILGSTYRIRIVEGEERLKHLRESDQPALLTFWHEGAMIFAYFSWQYLHRKGAPVTLLASKSRDGEVIARAGRVAGFPVVRGSSSRGGSTAIRQLYRAIVKEKSSPITIPDGPHGPIYQCKPGVATLAQMSGAPVLPLSFAVESSWRLGSWDRMYIPRPFARVEIAVGEPVHISRDLPKEELENQHQRVETVLNGLGKRTRDRFGSQPPKH